MANLLQMRALSQSIANARSTLAAVAGATFGGLRNISKALGYKEVLTVEDYRFRYGRNPIARRVVDAMPKSTWKGQGELIEDEDPNKITAFEEAWFDFSYKHKVWAMFNRADRAAGIGRFAVLLIGAPGELSTPLPKADGNKEVLYLAVHGEGAIEVDELEKNASNPRFGLPTMYKLKAQSISTASGSKALSVQDKKVHWTRCVHVADGLLDNDIYAEPRLQCVWNDLDNLEKIVGGGSEAFWLRAHQGYQFDLDPSVVLDAKGEEDLKEEVDEFLHGMRRALRTRGMKVTTLGSDTADFGGPVDSVLKLISAGSTIPLRILVGSERGQLASTQDADNWAERITDRRTEFAEPFVVRQLIDRLIEYGYLPKPEWYDVRWPVTELSEIEKTNVAKAMAEVNSKNGAIVFTSAEIRDRAMGMEPLDEADIPETETAVIPADQLPADDLPEEQLRAAIRALATKIRVRRRAGKAIDKRRKWWKQKYGNKPMPKELNG